MKSGESLLLDYHVIFRTGSHLKLQYANAADLNCKQVEYVCLIFHRVLVCTNLNLIFPAIIEQEPVVRV